MKLLLKVFFYLLTIFNTNIVEARVVVFDAAVSEIKLSISDIKGENYSTIILENDFDITCKTENALVAYRNWRDKRWTVAAKGGGSWVYGAFKSEAKWAGQLSKRGWTAEQITEAVTKGKSFDAVNMVNKANSATRHVHPTTGQSVVIDNVTKELLHVGGPGFKY